MREKQTIIIFEGVDMSGKSTIAKALSNQTGIPIFKMNVPKHFWDFLIHQRYSGEAITQMLEQTEQSVILDRSFVSDYMYALLFNRPYDLRKHIDTDHRFAAMNALIVYCYKDKEFFQHDEEDKDFVSVKDYTEMQNYYDIILGKTSCKVIRINTSDENLHNQLATIMSNI